MTQLLTIDLGYWLRIYCDTLGSILLAIYFKWNCKKMYMQDSEWMRSDTHQHRCWKTLSESKTPISIVVVVQLQLHLLVIKMPINLYSAFVHLIHRCAMRRWYAECTKKNQNKFHKHWQTYWRVIANGVPISGCYRLNFSAELHLTDVDENQMQPCKYVNFMISIRFWVSQEMLFSSVRFFSLYKWFI